MILSKVWYDNDNERMMNEWTNKIYESNIILSVDNLIIIIAMILATTFESRLLIQQENRGEDRYDVSVETFEILS